MAELLKSGLLYLMSEKCFDNYFLDFNFLDGKHCWRKSNRCRPRNHETNSLYLIIAVDCFKAILSKGLGLGIIAGSMLVKVPQITKILMNKSAEGINLFGVCMDLFAITIHMSYSFVSGFPFSAWGDSTFLAFQTAMIGSLVLFYEYSTAKASVFCALYTTLLYSLMGGLTPKEFLWSAQAFNLPILLIGKLSQAVTNYKNGSTGQLSAATCFMLFFGSIARIFTSVQETGDSMMILTYSVSTFANFVIVLQLLYYWNVVPQKAKTAAEKPKQKLKAKKDN
jgi:mannose-P-dolichol utilization defect protein 1